MSEEYDRMMGTHLMYLRNQKKISLQQVAKRTHFNKGYLSRIERGAVPVNSEIIRILTDCYDVEFSDSMEALDEAKITVSEAFRLNIIEELNSSKEVMERFLNHDYCIHSSVFFYIHLIRFMLYRDSHSEAVIEKYGEHVFDAKTMYIYYYYHLLDAMKTKQINEIDMYLKRMNTYRKQIVDHICSGVWYECSCTYELCQKHAPQAYLYAEKAENEYKQLLLFPRIRNVYLLKADCLSSMGCFFAANGIYQRLMDSCHDNRKNHDVIEDSYLWSKTNEEDYNYLIDTLKKKENQRRPIHELILSVCYYETEQYEKLLQLYEQKRHCNEYDVIQLFR